MGFSSLQKIKNCRKFEKQQSNLDLDKKKDGADKASEKSKVRMGRSIQESNTFSFLSLVLLVFQVNFLTGKFF